MSVSRETPASLAVRFGLPGGTADQLDRLLDALEREPDPPTTVRERGEAVDVHLADSLTGLEAPELAAAGRIGDVGSGAGFPGLPLAVALPGSRVDLIESARRKCEVIDRLAAAADIANATTIPKRAETWAAEDGREAYDAVTARALAPLRVALEYAAPLLREGGALVAWKGAREDEEEQAAARAAEKLGMERAGVRRVRPFRGAENRHLHTYVKTAPTPEAFPRRPGMAKKRPLG